MDKSGVLKILYVLDILKRTDETHPVNSREIIRKLEAEGLKAERKSIGNYIRILRDEMHYSIYLSENRDLGWYMTDQEFEDYELKMLVDAVASAKYLTVRDSRKLIDKLLKMATVSGRQIIKSTMFMEESLKLEDKKFTIKYDTVMRAIADRKQIRFFYADIGDDGRKQMKRDGARYQISPYYLGVWGDEYFVLANTAPHDNTGFYRVEMMEDVEIAEETVRPFSEIEGLKDIGRHGRTLGDYIKESIHLWSGDVKDIKISGSNHLRREVMKKFGNRLMFQNQGDGRFAVYVRVSDREGFYQWISRFGSSMKIESPEECVEKHKKFLQKAIDQYVI